MSMRLVKPDGTVYAVTPTAPAGATLEPAPEPVGAVLAWQNVGEARQRVSLDEAVVEGWVESQRPVADAAPQAGLEERLSALRAPGTVYDLMDSPRPEEVAPAPARHESRRAREASRTLLTDQEFAVLDLLAEADGIFMQMPSPEPEQRGLWRSHLALLEALVMRKAAIRAYPGRFVGE